MKKEFKYEFGISLCNDDLQTAREIVRLSNISKDKIYLYEYKQDDLLAKNAVIKFTSTFKNDCRIIVVLHSNKYGTTDYTNLEENAITERILHEKNKHFIVFIRLDDSPVPSWYDPHFIHLRKKDFTLEQITNFIDMKVKEQGGDYKEITLEEKLEKYNASFNKELEIEFFDKNASTNSIHSYKEELAKIHDYFKSCKAKFAKYPNLIVAFESDGDFKKEYSLLFHHRSRTGIEFSPRNMDDHYQMYLNLNFKIFGKLAGEGAAAEKQRIIESDYFYFSINEEGEFVWRPQNNPRDYITTEELMDKKMRRFVDLISEKTLNITK